MCTHCCQVIGVLNFPFHLHHSFRVNFRVLIGGKFLLLIDPPRGWIAWERRMPEPQSHSRIQTRSHIIVVQLCPQVTAHKNIEKKSNPATPIFFVTCISIWRLKIWYSLGEPQASSFGERNNINYCRLGVIFGCLLHWTHCWRFSLPLIAWLGRANKLSAQNKGAMFHRLNDRIRKSQIPLLPIHKTRGSKGMSRLYCSTFDIYQLILVVPSYLAKVLVCNWKARSTGEHWEPLPFPLSLIVWIHTLPNGVPKSAEKYWFFFSVISY